MGRYKSPGQAQRFSLIMTKSNPFFALAAALSPLDHIATPEPMLTGVWHDITSELKAA